MAPNEDKFQPKAIIFDLLTALLDSWSAWNAAAGSEEAGMRWRSMYLTTTFSAGEYVPYSDLVREAAVLAGIPSSAAETLLGEWPDNLNPWDDVKTTLDRLRARGYKLGVITNCSREQGRAAAQRCGVDFDAVVTAEDCGFYKPRAEAYQAGLTALGLAAKDTLFVAGSPGDVGGASKAGMTVVWHNHIGLPPKGDIQPLKEARSLGDALKGFL